MFDPDLCDQSFETKFKTGCLFEWYVPNSVEETEINMCGCQIYLLVNNTVILIIIICLFSSLMHKNDAGGNTTMVIKATSSSREEGTSHILTHDGSQC